MPFECCQGALPYPGVTCVHLYFLVEVLRLVPHRKPSAPLCLARSRAPGYCAHAENQWAGLCGRVSWPLCQLSVPLVSVSAWRWRNRPAVPCLDVLPESADGWPPLLFVFLCTCQNQLVKLHEKLCQDFESNCVDCVDRWRGISPLSEVSLPEVKPGVSP